MISDAVRAPPGGASAQRYHERREARDVLSLIAVAATFAAIIALFAISPVALEAHGIPYIDAGGGFFAKFHPATPIAICAFVLRCLAARRPVHAAWRLGTGDAGVLLLLASVTVTTIFAAVVDKTPVTPLVDTFVLPILIFILLRDLDRRAAAWLATFVAAILVANAGIALLEYLRGFHLIQVQASPDLTDDPTKANAVFSWKADMALDWRAQALLGHPLVNGLVVGAFIICLAAPGAAWIPAMPRIALLLLEGVSMFAFGARTALVLTFLIAVGLFAAQCANAIERGVRLTPRGTAPALLAIGVGTVAVTLLAYSGLIDKTLDRFNNDLGSASTRVTMFALLTPIPLTDLVLHPDKDLVATLQRVYGLEFGIESSWIGLTLTYGLAVAVIVTAGLLAFLRSVVRASGRGAILVCFFYLVLISVTASLSTKTTSLAMVVALVLLFLRQDASPAPAARRVPRK